VVTEAPRCEGCGTPLSPHDRICFSCRRPTQQQAEPVRRPPAVDDERQSRSKPLSGLEIEVIIGRRTETVRVPPDGLTFGSTSEAGVVIPAPFLAPVHAHVTADGGDWMIRPASHTAVVLHRGRPVDEALLVDGDIVRLADRVGNFATLRARSTQRARGRSIGLRGRLPAPGQQITIGSDAVATICLDHPLVRPKHAVVFRDLQGRLFVEDNAPVVGTYVGGVRATRHQRLAAGDLIQVGPYSARIGVVDLEPLGQVAGIELQVQAASVEVAQRVEGQRRARLLLSQVSLRLAPASMTAVAGPSGAGKTTLMRLLAGQLPPSTGKVAYNGVDLRECRRAYAGLMGFVPQDDIVHADLTVGEALSYQARLRLGEDSRPEQRAMSVARALSFVGLDAQQNQLVRTLSGGQRKRVSVATEILNEPHLLFLDEPTSGLDPGLDKRMMLLLRLLADQGRTVVLTTHSIAHVSVCDNLVVVGPGGHVIYAGPPDEAASWFGVEALGDIFSLVDTPELSAQAAMRLTHLERAAAGGATVTEVDNPRSSATRVANGSSHLLARWWPRVLRSQTRLYAGRQVRLISRDPVALSFSLLQGIAVCVLTALVAPKPLVWSQNGNAPMFVFGCAAVWFGMINSVRELVKERTIWRREQLVGARVPAYLASKILVLGLLALFQSMSSVVVIKLTLGLPSGGPLGSAFVTIFVTLWLANMAGMSLGLMTSAMAPSSDRAISVVPYLLITQLVLCGVLFPLGALKFVSYIIPARWAVSALGGIASLSAAALHQTPGLYPSSAGGLVANWLVLCLLTLAGTVVTANVLKREAAGWSVG
jgi:ABC transport system ATP-binding/permease protein